MGPRLSDRKLVGTLCARVRVGPLRLAQRLWAPRRAVIAAMLLVEWVHEAYARRNERRVAALGRPGGERELRLRKLGGFRISILKMRKGFIQLSVLFFRSSSSPAPAVISPLIFDRVITQS